MVELVEGKDGSQGTRDEIGEEHHLAILYSRKLAEQETPYICTMQSNAKKIMEGDVISINPLTKLWRIIDANSMLQHNLSEQCKLAEIAIVLVLGSVEDERTFSTLSFMKDKLRNRVHTHLPLVVGMHSQSFFDIKNFPYDQAYSDWKKRTCLTDNA
jgi:hypothetical protein